LVDEISVGSLIKKVYKSLISPLPGGERWVFPTYLKEGLLRADFRQDKGFAP